MRWATPIVFAVLALAGCGGDETATTSGAADLMPANTALYAEIDSSLDSGQWQQVDELLDRFPGRDRLIAALGESLREEGLTREDFERGFGDVVSLAVFDFEQPEETVVGLTQPDDEQALRKLFEEDDFVFRQVGEWTAFAENEAVFDRLSGGGESLADADRFAEAWGELPEDALARVFVSGVDIEDALQQAGTAIPGSSQFDAAVAAVTAEDDGARLTAKTLGQEEPLPDLTFAEDVPAGAILFANFHGSEGTTEGLRDLRSNPLIGSALQQAEQQLGVTLDEVARLFEGEIAFYVRPGVVIPEVTLVLEAPNEAEARATLDKLGEGIGNLLGAGARQRKTIAGVQATELNLGPVSILYAVFDGRAVVTTLPVGIEDLREEGDRLADDDAFTEARDSAGEGDVVLFVDLDETIDLVTRLAQLSDEDIPAEVRENLEPLRAFVVTAEGGDGETTIDAFLSLD